MRIGDMNWMQVEDYLRHDDRAVLPLGSTEQHGYLRLTVDNILPEQVAAEAAEPLGVPVFPVVAYGVTPYFRDFPGSISLRVETHLNVVRDILDSLAHSGFRRILIVNGHGGNAAVQHFVPEWVADHPDCRVRLPQLVERAAHLGQGAGDRSCRVACVVDGEFSVDASPDVALPSTQRPMVDLASVRALDPVALRAYLGDGNYGGLYQRSDDDMLALWRVAVDETRSLLTGAWGDA